MRVVPIVALSMIAIAGDAPGPDPARSGGFAAEYGRLLANPDGLPEPERLRRLFDVHWRQQMIEYPEFATLVGHPGQNHRWSDRSLDAVARRRRDLEEPLRVARVIDRAAIGAEDRLSLDLFVRLLEEQREAGRFPDELLPLSPLRGIQQEAAQLLAASPAATLRDCQDLVGRLESLPAVVDQTIALLQEGVARGITPPRVTLRDVPDQVGRQIVDDPLQSPVLEAFRRLPADLGEADRRRLLEAAGRAYATGIRPAFERLRAYLLQTYLPRARTTVGLRDLPDGEAWYAFRVRHQTTTHLTPRAIHDLGRREVERLRAEMETVREASGFKGDLREFGRFLRSDPRFFFTDAESLVREYRDIAKRVDPELVRLFGRLPRLPYGVRPVPAYAEKSQTTAYYEPGSLQAGRPGWFFANTHDLGSRPRWEMEALTLHEAVPGHHLQIALAQEMEGVPQFRRHWGPTAFVEGWALYAESLGGELGMYRDPYARFGQLTYEMWRAIRLVIDTGLHAFGWSRDQAIAYFRENSAKTDHDIVVEVDRYIVDPGQALGYKIGELRIRELRSRARAALGERFDPRAFHDAVLAHGALPLDLLEREVDRHIAAAAAGR
jgi:uncharacterized protein (DUF885 family)